MLNDFIDEVTSQGAEAVLPQNLVRMCVHCRWFLPQSPRFSLHFKPYPSFRPPEVREGYEDAFAFFAHIRTDGNGKKPARPGGMYGVFRGCRRGANLYEPSLISGMLFLAGCIRWATLRRVMVTACFPKKM